MSIAREGWPFIGIATLLAAALWVALVTGAAGGWLRAAAWAATLTAAFTLWFFRNPEPEPPADPQAVVAPGQGKILEIVEEDEPVYLEGRAVRITIFLSVFDVHVQRAPVSGVVGHRTYTPGKFLAAWNDKASTDNEQAALGIETPEGRVLVKQIAGLVARRVVTDPEVGERVERGSRIGLIRFGSRVDLLVPAHWEITCSVGDRVRVGSTVLARRPRGPEA